MCTGLSSREGTRLETYAAALATAVVAVLTIAAPALAAPADLDTTWGDGGRVVLSSSTPEGNVQGTQLVRQSTGAVLLASSDHSYDPETYQSDSHVAVRRLGAAGQLDAAFGVEGTAVLDFGRPANVRDTVVLSDDRLLVLADLRGDGFEGSKVGLGRLTADGALDPTFGQGGVVVTDLQSQRLRPRAVALSPDGSALVGLEQDARMPDTADFAVARYTPSGALDSTYGSAGVRLVDVGASDYLTDLVSTPSGQLVAVGYTAGAGRQSAAAVGLLDDGSLDRSFGKSGRVVVDLAGRECSTSPASSRGPARWPPTVPTSSSGVLSATGPSPPGC